MQAIDWSKAPEWALGHGLIVSGVIKEVWFSGKAYMVVGDSRSYVYGGGLGETRHNHTSAVIQFKTYRPKPWTGEGLPPVGTVCEWAGPNSDGPDGWVFTESKVVAYTDCKAFVIMQKQGCWPVVNHVNNCQFRPIRTPEQIKAEEREQAYQTMVADLSAAIGLSNIDIRECDVLHALADAGWRKQVTE